MASLKKRGTTYYAQYYVGDKQVRKCLHTDSLQLAKEKLRRLESALYRGETDPGPTRTPLPDVLADFLAHQRLVRTPASYRSDVCFLRQVFGPLCPALQFARDPGGTRRGLARIETRYLEQVTSADISRCIRDHVQSRNLAPKTANRYREVLSRLFNWAMDERGVRMPGGTNPVAKVERYRVPAPDVEFLTRDDIDRQLSALEDEPLMRVAVATFIFAGLRRSELLWLTKDDVDFSAGNYGVIRVRAKQDNGEMWQPKTKTNRVVPISSTLRRYLDAYVLARPDSPWFFPSPAGYRWDPDNFSAHLRVVNREAGLRWNCLHYRHTFGSQLASNGVSLYKIAQLMGNSPEICRRHYAALIPESLEEAVEFHGGPERAVSLRLVS